LEAPLLAPLIKDKKVLAAFKKHRELIARRSKVGIGWPKIERMKPRIISGSTIFIKVPPYDQGWQWQQGQADPKAGTFGYGISGGGGHVWAGAGVAEWFFTASGDLCSPDTPACIPTRFAALVDYAYTWMNSSCWDTAHNNATLHIGVWGANEKDWVTIQVRQPSWSDGTGWLDNHGSNGDGSEVEGREAIDVCFSAQPNAWYHCWVGSTGKWTIQTIRAIRPVTAAQPWRPIIARYRSWFSNRTGAAVV